MTKIIGYSVFPTPLLNERIYVNPNPIEPEDTVEILNPPYFYGGKDDPEMAGNRQRNKIDGKLRKKRSDSKLKNLVKKYPELSKLDSVEDNDELFNKITLGDLEKQYDVYGVHALIDLTKKGVPKFIQMEE